MMKGYKLENTTEKDNLAEDNNSRKDKNSAVSL